MCRNGHSNFDLLIFPLQVIQLKEIVQCITAEKDSFSAENSKSIMKELQASTLSLTEERDYLLDILRGLKEEKNQLGMDLEKAQEMVLTVPLF